MIIQELIDKYFTTAHSELGEENYLVSKNSKFILDFHQLEEEDFKKIINDIYS